MNGRQIDRILSMDTITSPFFQGVYSIDTIPLLREKSAIVINNDESWEAGSHWLALFVDERKRLEFYDSYGKPPDFYGHYLNNYVSHYSNVCWNSITFQSPTSNVCGHYCIYFLRRRCMGDSMYSIIHHLCQYKSNDFRLYQFVKKKYGVRFVFRK